MNAIKHKTAADYLKLAKVRIEHERLSDDSIAHSLMVGDVEFPCYSERHAEQAAMDIAVALHNASNGLAAYFLRQ